MVQRVQKPRIWRMARRWEIATRLVWSCTGNYNDNFGFHPYWAWILRNRAVMHLNLACQGELWPQSRTEATRGHGQRLGEQFGGSCRQQFRWEVCVLKIRVSRKHQRCWELFQFLIHFKNRTDMSAKGLDIGCERKKELKGDFKGFVPSSWKDRTMAYWGKKDLDQNPCQLLSVWLWICNLKTASSPHPSLGSTYKME